MKLIKILPICLSLLLIGAMGASADVTFPNQDSQKAFAQKFFDANAQGDHARQGFVNDVFQHGSEADQAMWRNLDEGLTPDGSRKLSDGQKQQLMEEYAAQKNKPSGFMGDAKDPGPQDWSDTLIETDAAGNVTGFKPRDWYERDTDGDGEVSAEEQRAHESKEQVKNMDKDGDGIASLDEIRAAEKEMDVDGDGKVSDEERKDWNDKKSDERKNGPGSPGNVPPIADWDQDQDGQPDEGYRRSCWQCCPGEKDLNECHYGYPGTCDNGGSCDISEMCIDAPEVHDDVEYECHLCEYKDDWPDPCAVYGLYSSASCNSACSPIDACYAVYFDQTDGTRRTSTVMKTDLICYECGTSVQPPPKCEDGLLDGVCQGDDCEGYDTCRTVGDYCHICEDPTVECRDGSTEGICSDTSCPSHQKCIQSGKCYTCQSVERGTENPCEERELASGGCPGSCSEDQTCDEQKVGNATCHQCGEKVEESSACYESQMQDGPCTDDACPSEDSECRQQTVDGATCHFCQVKAMTALETCPDGALTGSCPGNCSEGSECVPVSNNCHTCQPSETTSCYEMDLITFEDCSTCLSNQGKCEAAGRTPDGVPCFRCVRDPDNTCPDGLMPGGCSPVSCSEGVMCLEEEGCHHCQRLGSSICPDGYFWGQCSADSCESPFVCDGEQGESGCIRCVPPLEESDECARLEALTGPCPGTCSEGQECAPAGENCHRCEEKKECADYGYADSCYGCHAQFKQCRNVNVPEIQRECAECYSACPAETLPLDQCEFACGLVGKPCVPTAQGDDGTTCYTCGEAGSCETYDLFCSCSECYEDEECVPARSILDPKTGDQFVCVDCIPYEMIESVEYYILIVETPFVRYVLDPVIDARAVFANADLGGFQPQQVMALADAGSLMDQIKGGIGMLPGVGGAMGMISGKTVTIDQLAGLLNQGLDSGRGYSSDCFGEMEDGKAELPQEAPPVPPRKSKQPTGGDEIGADSSQAMMTTGPMVVCGEKDGEKALAVLDSHGRPVATILREYLKENPNAVAQALQKAERLSREVRSLQQDGVKGLLQRGANALGQTLMEKVTNAFKGSDDKAALPDDPYFLQGEGKKRKKLLGIFGSSKEAAPVTIGSGIRQGKTAMGGGSGSSRQKEEARDQWGLHAVGYLPMDDPESAWHFVDATKKNVVVAVIDSGLDLDHPDGPEYIWVNSGEISGNGMDDDGNGYVDDVHGWNFIDNSHDFTDERGHGTHVAGIIAARTNNGRGIAGINPGAVIMPLKVTDVEGQTNSLNIFRAIHYAVDNGARVINISLGGVGVSDLEQAALSYARSRGVFVAVASGNTGEYIGDVGPASAVHAFTVGMIDMDMERSTVSSTGPNNALLAPGEQIISLFSSDTKGNVLPSIREAGVHPQNGTSFATPMVSATAALLLVQDPGLTADDIRDILLRSADNMYEEGWDHMSGAGLLNATAALRRELAVPVTVVINQLRKVEDERGRKTEFVDVFATVEGNFKEYYLEISKGNRGGRYQTLTGPYTRPASHGWLTRLNVRDHLRGSDEWMIRVRVVAEGGKEYTAEALLELQTRRRSQIDL